MDPRCRRDALGTGCEAHEAQMGRIFGDYFAKAPEMTLLVCAFTSEQEVQLNTFHSITHTVVTKHK